MDYLFCGFYWHENKRYDFEFIARKCSIMGASQYLIVRRYVIKCLSDEFNREIKSENFFVTNVINLNNLTTWS